jgi:outer membrane receptor protein involved in Fe transport
LFERNRAQFNGSGSVGTQDTWSGEAVVSGVYNWLSLSAGAYHYETDGWRPNTDAEHDIQNVYLQAAVTPELNLQFEYRSRDTSYGDLATDFDPNVFLPDLNRELEQDIARAGVRYSPTPNSDILLSYMYSDRAVKTEDVLLRFFGGCPFADPTDPTCPVWDITDIDEEGGQTEAQYLYRSPRFDLVAGGGFTDIDRQVIDDRVIYLDSGVVHAGGFPVIGAPTGASHSHGYIYTHVKLPEPVTWTLGVAYDDFENPSQLQDVTEVSPKFGVQWDVTRQLRLRAAAGQVVKPALISNRTLEPTQVAGVNQFYDEPNGTVSRQYGAGLDWNASDSLFFGLEGGWRRVDVPFTGFGAHQEEERKEQTHRAYGYWAPVPQWAVSAEFVYDQAESEQGLLTAFLAFPLEVETISVPIEVRYFHRNGLFAGLGATYVHQDVDREPAFSFIAGSDDFISVDAVIGWRLPNRLGMISLEARNLLDEQFNYQDDNYRQFGDDPAVSPYAHERTVMGRLSLKF